MEEDEFVKNLVSEFIDEALELLDDFEEVLLENENTLHEIDVGNLFRIMHTIKGSAYTVGLKDVGGFVHNVEFLLSDIREDKLEFTEEILDILLDSYDITKQFLVDKSKLNTEAIDSITKKIEALLDSEERKKSDSNQAFGFFDENEDAKTTNVNENSAFGFFDEDEDAKTTKVNTNSAFGFFDDEKAFMNPYTAGTNPKILICEDDESVSEIIKAYLREEGYDCDYANDGLAGLSKIEKNYYDTIITDINMPRMNGVELIQEIRDSKVKTPILVISGFPTLENFHKLLNLNVHGFIDKPIIKEDFVTKVNSCIKINFLRRYIQQFINENYKLYINISKLLFRIPEQTKVENQDMFNPIEKSLEEVIQLANASLKI